MPGQRDEPLPPTRDAAGRLADQPLSPFLVTPGEDTYIWASRHHLSDPGRLNKGRGDGEAWIRGAFAGIGDPRDPRRPRHRATGLSTHPARRQFWPVHGTEPLHRWRPNPAGPAGSNLLAHSERRHSGKTATHQCGLTTAQDGLPHWSAVATTQGLVRGNGCPVSRSEWAQGRWNPTVRLQSSVARELARSRPARPAQRIRL
jgi:hypothetical protein